MDRIEIEERIYNIFNSYGSAMDYVPGVGFCIIKDDIDSLKMISLLVEIEEEFDKDIPDVYLSDNLLDSSNVLVDIMDNLINEKR